MTDPRTSFTVSTRDMHEAIGAAMTQWAWVEDALVKLLHAVLGCELEQAGIIWYSVVAFRGKLEMVDALMQQATKAKPLMKRWPSCQSYLGELSSKRNQLAHWELVGAVDRDDGELPTMRYATPRLVPHTFDATPKMAKYKNGIGIEDVKFFNRSFRYVSGEVKELYLHTLGYLPWQDKFSAPIGRLKKTDGPSHHNP